MQCYAGTKCHKSSGTGRKDGYKVRKAENEAAAAVVCVCSRQVVRVG